MMTVATFRSLVVVVLFAAVSTTEVAGGQVHCPNPGLDCQRVLVVPVKYPQPLCPDPGKPCPDNPALFIDPPRIHAADLGATLTSRVNPHYDDWSQGTWQFTFDVLVNPNSGDGWWVMPASLQDYLVAFAEGATFWKRGAASRAIVEDAIETIAAAASEAGLIPPLATYSRFFVLDNQHARYGQAAQESYSVPAIPFGGGWLYVPHVFTGAIGGIGADDNALEPLVSHELGHQLGLLDFYGTCFFTDTPLPPFSDECNGPWDVMAFDWDGPNHPTGFNKLALGWLPDDAQRVRTLPPPDTAWTTSLTLHPIERLDYVQARLARIPFTAYVPGSPFEGFHLECRRRIDGDEPIPEEGVLIQLVRETKLGVSGTYGVTMTARVVRSDPPFASIYSAALQPGGSWTDPVRGIHVDFVGYASSAPDAACLVDVESVATGQKPDPALEVAEGVATGLWVDSPVNGLFVYPPSQPVDGDGVPAGPGDPFLVQGESRLRFRVRNLGTASTPTVALKLVAEQPPVVACGAGGTKLLDEFVFLAPIVPGGSVTGDVVLYAPEASGIRVRARILPVANEVTVANNEAERVFSSTAQVSVVGADGPAQVVVAVPVYNGCPGDLLVGAVPKIVPVAPGPRPDPVLDRWRVTLPGLTAVPEGGAAVVEMTFTPPGSSTPGSGVSIPTAIQQGGGTSFDVGAIGGSSVTELDVVDVAIPVVAPTTVSLSVPVGPHEVGEPVPLSGTLDPDAAASDVGLRFTAPSGGTTWRVATTDGLGAFADAFVTPETGRWSVEALWPGDATRAEAASVVAGFVVVPGGVACGGAAECDDGNPCTRDACGRSGLCEYELEPDGTSCDDGDACSTGSTCVAGACGERVWCDDLDPCTVDRCDPGTGSCSFQIAAGPEVSALRFDTPSALEWSAASGASGWNTYRGTIPALGLGSRRDPYDEICLEGGDALGDGILITTDRETPGPGLGFYYLVTQQSLCGEGPIGTAPDGAPRYPPNPCMGP